MGIGPSFWIDGVGRFPRTFFSDLFYSKTRFKFTTSDLPVLIAIRSCSSLDYKKYANFDR